MKCDSCQMLAINGVPCHETGCPKAWKDEKRECSDCGRNYTAPRRGPFGLCPRCERKLMR